MSEQSTPSNVISLVSKIEEAKIEAATPRVYEDVVDVLERYLEDAKAGKIVSIAIATVNAEDSTSTAFTGSSHIVAHRHAGRRDAHPVRSADTDSVFGLEFCRVEQSGQLGALITRRSSVQIRPLQPNLRMS